METHILEMLDSASTEDLWLGAEAVVDAALFRRALLGFRPLSTEERLNLVNAVFDDPSLIGALFSGNDGLH